MPDITRILGKLEGVEVAEEKLGVVARMPFVAVHDALVALKSDGFESLMDFDGIDTGEAIELTWRVRSYSADIDTFVKASLPYDGTLVSMWGVFPSALMPERETAELLGLHLDFHPNPKRLLTTEAVPPLLRKSVPIRTVEEVRNR